LGADLLSIGRSALNASKKSLATASHNIANANTEGYSRQRVNLRTLPPIGSDNVVMGTGVDIRSVKRIHDNLIEKKLATSVTTNEYDKEREFQLTQVEDIYNEINMDGLNKTMGRFFNSFRELANKPEDETIRSIVRENAKTVITDFKRHKENLDLIRSNIDRKITSAVGDINLITKAIGKLNKEIRELEATHGETGDLRDQRDSQVRELSKYLKINTYTDNKGQYVVNANGMGSLVIGNINIELASGMINPTDSAKNKGQAEIYFSERKDVMLTNKIKGGMLGALIDTREQEVTHGENKTDELAYNLVHLTNAIHRKGFVNKPIQLDQQGQPIGGAKVTGINFFKEPLDIHRAAEYIELSDEVKSDINNITSAFEANKPGDNRISIAVSKLQSTKVLGDRTTTFEEEYLKLVGEIGLKTSKARINTEHSQGLLNQAKAVKQSISGVSIDEETSNMVKHQQAYEASARVIRVADEMFDSVLGIMR
jgi:flagellar hook-associated protein 1 FlgK